MDFNDVLTTFLSLERVRILAVYGRVRELSEFIKNIFICVLKMKVLRVWNDNDNDNVINDIIFIFGELSL